MEAIHKLQPNRTIALRGFDDRGAAAALHAATADSFKVSGVFRDPADFCVLMLFDADNFYEHPRLKFLPDFSFAGVVLQFDVRSEGLQPVDSNKFPTIDWPYLDVVRADGSSAQLTLFDYATQQGGSYTQASADFLVTASPAVAFDRVTLVYQNLKFDYIAAGGESAADVADILVAQINAASSDIDAERVGSAIRVRARKGGRDGNMIGLYAQSKTATLTLSPGFQKLTGGSSDATWRVRLDFSAALGGTAEIRQMWLTFAPALADGAAYESTEFVATFTNWLVTGANAALQVAGPGSVRVEEDDRWCTYSGDGWTVVPNNEEAGFYSKGFGRRSANIGDAVTVAYSCPYPHDLYLGTGLHSNRGLIGVRLDGEAETTLNCYLDAATAVNTRRLLRSGVSAGEHSVVLRHAAGGPVYFDFIEAAVPSDVPDALEPRPLVSAAMDYGTNHSYLNSAARVMWWNAMLGHTGPLNVYGSVFWGDERDNPTRQVASCSIDFAALGIVDGDSVFVKVADFAFGCSVFPPDTPESIALHFAIYMNSFSVGTVAEASGSVLTISNRAVGSAYNFTVEAWKESPARTDIDVTGSLLGGVAGLWVIDPSKPRTLNRAIREWLADLLAECSTRNTEITIAWSMEMLNPPDNPEAGEVWASRYPNGDPVLTATGFSTNVTTHCAFSPAVLEFQKRRFLETADLMAAAGVPVIVQVGEFTWWYFNSATPPTSNPAVLGTSPVGKGMAYYDAATQARANAELGRDLALFTWPESDPSVNGYADADLLRRILDGHIRAISDHVKASHPTAQIEILLALDVNFRTQAGRFDLGGQLNHYINVPPSFLDPATAPFDRIKMEALDWQVGSRDTDLSRETMRFPYEAGSWPRNRVRVLIGNFNGGACWERAYLDAVGEGLACINYWAHDHIHIFGWDVLEPVDASAAQLL